VSDARTRRAVVLALVAMLPLGCRPPPGPADDPTLGNRAHPADAFVDSVGVATHLSYGDTDYNDFDDVREKLLSLGIRHIRDGIEYEPPNGAPVGPSEVTERFRELASLGVRLTGVVPYEVEDMESLVEQIKEQRDLLEAVEGPNETDIFEQFSYRGMTFPDGTIAFMEDFHGWLESDTELADLPVVQTTLAFPGAEDGGGDRADRLGDLSEYADFGSSHNYFAFGEAPSGPIENHHLPLNTKVTPGKPMISTEGGYQMGAGDGYKGTWDDGLSAPFDEPVHGRYLLRYVLEQFRLGYERSFIYELLSIDEPEWGLYRPDGTPRPAANGLQSLIGLLGEATWDGDAGTWSTPDFEPGTLDYDVSALPASVHSLLFQKSDGRFYLVLWNDANNWDAERGEPTFNDSLSATLTVKQDVSRIRTFVPLTNGTSPTSSADSNSLDIAVPDHPLVVEITPG
jgi:hypothetical protein